MQEITATLYDCNHCGGQGTCKNGKDNSSCLACAKKNELWFWQQDERFGLLCGSCGGIGRAEPLTERVNKRIAPFLACFLVFSLLFLIFWATFARSQYFSELLAFASAIIGSVVGFYFSNRKNFN